MTLGKEEKVEKQSWRYVRSWRGEPKLTRERITVIDLEKAFEKVDWKLLSHAMKRAGYSWKDRRLILNIHRPTQIFT